MSSSGAVKRRILPAWMSKKTVEPAQWAEMRSKRRKRTALARTETVYCMNEAELVDTALCILAENCKATGGDVISSEDEGQELQQELTDGHHSRSATNIAKDPPVRSTPPDELASLSCGEETKLEEDDDALKYVREIFFT
ncbi:cell cycle regulator of non-homologous end joining [Python bivittatus]|uniref:Cell cycle regulator of non-homologous end joining n=1 Tax=Python bivittatus TaxID=176946 RepID=A0A9F5IR11_PYTBI|nr:cell cycle regulator of non-homologous end joining [Python bivittatus]XP_025019152.1 cell cycle regulator of non-homologous end joining [Python bivittatus]XP_025019153.1 cell cycle regulator of non-homologous end joining [Python bivittatus]XP_025019154.1 cell cycle regulator of non-homologous end joining [Python bivittatus]XP_025019155.1 cell cycle regulator of non-homologous end joining [Python bivittatus]